MAQLGTAKLKKKKKLRNYTSTAIFLQVCWAYTHNCVLKQKKKLLGLIKLMVYVVTVGSNPFPG